MQILRIIGYSDVFQGIDFFGAVLFWPAWSILRGMPRSTLSQEQAFSGCSAKRWASGTPSRTGSRYRAASVWLSTLTKGPARRLMRVCDTPKLAACCCKELVLR